jgi:hypothetical protein
LPDKGRTNISRGALIVKANLARFTYALVVLATMALSLGAGKRW